MDPAQRQGTLYPALHRLERRGEDVPLVVEGP
jgi:hypothetical protein